MLAAQVREAARRRRVSRAQSNPQPAVDAQTLGGQLETVRRPHVLQPAGDGWHYNFDHSQWERPIALRDADPDVSL